MTTMLAKRQVSERWQGVSGRKPLWRCRYPGVVDSSEPKYFRIAGDQLVAEEYQRIGTPHPDPRLFLGTGTARRIRTAEGQVAGVPRRHRRPS
jgi:hypothetical protein